MKAIDFSRLSDNFVWSTPATPHLAGYGNLFLMKKINRRISREHFGEPGIKKISLSIISTFFA